ncbi:protein trichome birefringence-like 36 [Beta vulgaris subsp. vulgaris]|uniref:protein trichome birefringence-like 36 n=1 Tax=Beta vulgaris subsp. vulgaris TaxID=3555 RepID=UPI002036D689|nr:protein trichome birefringence-like 36 [Beta vulgaris subsp. vulgaris]
MKFISTINDTWKLCALGSLFAWLILLLSTKQNNQNASFLSAVQFSPFGVSAPPTLSMINETENASNLTSSSTKKAEVTPKKNLEKPLNMNIQKTCDMFNGRWVFKPQENPRYNSIRCPFIEEKFSCQKNGRPDSDYEKWVWEAKDCDIPSFNGTNMLEKLRNKRVIVVGDSLNRNMWESLSCLLYSFISSSSAEVHADDPVYKVFKAKDYNLIVEFFWSPFLVEFNEKHETGKRVLVVDKLSPNYKLWRGADIMVFNSGHWWTHTGKFKAWDLFQYKGQLMEEMPMELAYERAMKTWATWIEKSVDSKRTKLLFRSISAVHNKQWCYNSTHPIVAESYEDSLPKSLTSIIEKIINDKSKSHAVTYLNITKLSHYRIDAHPSAYKSKKWEIYTKKYKNSLMSYVDCSHWCLPGLPDTWNRLLYASLFDSFGNMIFS